jgi:transcriptional antiterminator RfaH
MDYWQETRWFAVHAKTAREEFAATSVTALGLEVLLPKLQKKRRVRGVAKPWMAPLFPGYFFARFSPAQSLDQVRYAPGVLRVISSGRMPIALDEGIVPALRARLEPDGVLRLAETPLQRGAMVIVQEGPFAGLIGRFEQEWDDRARVVILLEAIQYARVVIEKRWITQAAA